MNISQVAQKTNLTAVTLRYYEKVGLIPPVDRKNGGVRRYSQEDIVWIDFIKCMRNAGISVDALIKYTSLFAEGSKTVRERELILEGERASLLAKYNELGAKLQRLDKKINYYKENNHVCEDQLIAMKSI